MTTSKRDDAPRTKSNRAHVFALAVALLGLAAPAAAEPQDGGAHASSREKVEDGKLDGLLTAISRARANVKTMRANFTQTRRITLLATSVTSHGELTMAAPDRLRWDLAPPDDIVYFVGPEGLSYKTKSSSATVPANGRNVGRALGDLRALLTGDLAALKDRYTLSATRTAADVAIDGVAKDKNASVKAFSLVLDKDLVTPLRARLTEGKRDGIDLVFSDVALNSPVDLARLRP